MLTVVLPIFVLMTGVTKTDIGTSEIHKTMIDVLCKQRSGLNIVHFNARSLNDFKLDCIKYTFEDSAIDVICISETWFHKDITDSHLNLRNYKLFRNDRKNKKGGGVAIYCKVNLNVNLLSKSDGSEVEFLNVEIYDNRTKIFISCVYNPNRNCSLDTLFTSLSSCVIDFDHFVLCGDFNINILNRDNLADKFVDNINEVGFNIVNSSIPTRFSNNACPSLLDIFVVSDISSVLIFDQISFISDHDLIFCTLNINFTLDIVENTFYFRDYKSINFDALHFDASLINWSDCRFFSSVNDKLDFFISKINNLFDSHVPFRAGRVQNIACPWFTNHVKSALKNRHKSYEKWKRIPNSANWVEYRKARNAATSAVRNSKRNFFSSKLSPNQSTKQLWNNLRQIGVCSKEFSVCKIDPNLLNDFFIRSAISDSTNIPDCENQAYANLPNSFEFSAVCEVDVAMCIHKIKSNAIGEDGISIKFIKLIMPFVLSSLTHIINHCFTCSYFPDVWKLSTITPIAKKVNASEPGDFRPVSLLSSVSKVFESLMAKQISGHIKEFGLMSPFQSGYRPGHSCSTAVVKILDDIRVPYDMGHLTLLCLLDFSKAFDTVDHLMLCRKLEARFGFSKMAVNLLRSYLVGRTQRVRVGKNYSTFKQLCSGVPQGSVLGPLLFTMFIDDIFSRCQHVTMHAYADDLQLYLSRPIGLVEDLCARVNEDLCSIAEWSRLNKLKLNPLKSYILPISKNNYPFPDLPNIFLNNVELKYVSKVKNLGFHINTTLSCENHINNAVSKVYYALRNLRRTASFVPFETRRKLVIQLIVPIITYSEVVYSRLDSRSSHKLLVAFNNAARYVFGLRKFDHIAIYSSQLLGCSLINYLELRNCIFLHKLIHGKIPHYLYEKLQFCKSSRNMNLLIPSYNFMSSSRLFFVSAIRLWNSLPINIKIVSNKNHFKHLIFKHFS